MVDSVGDSRTACWGDGTPQLSGPAQSVGSAAARTNAYTLFLAGKSDGPCVRTRNRLGHARQHIGVMEQFRIWFGVSWSNQTVQLVGTGLLLLSVAVRWNQRNSFDFRLRFLCSLLVFMVIFNHQSESPSFVIAVTGIAIWYVWFPRTGWRTALMTLTILVVSVSSTDITPPWLRHTVFEPYKLKTVPCMLAWVVLQWELMVRGPHGSGEHSEMHELDVAAREARAHG